MDLNERIHFLQDEISSLMRELAAATARREYLRISLQIEEAERQERERDRLEELLAARERELAKIIPKLARRKT